MGLYVKENNKLKPIAGISFEGESLSEFPTRFDDDITFLVAFDADNYATAYTYNATKKGTINVSFYHENKDNKYAAMRIKINGQVAATTGGTSSYSILNLTANVKPGDVVVIETRKNSTERIEGTLRFYY